MPGGSNSFCSAVLLAGRGGRSRRDFTAGCRGCARVVHAREIKRSSSENFTSRVASRERLVVGFAGDYVNRVTELAAPEIISRPRRGKF